MRTQNQLTARNKSIWEALQLGARARDLAIAHGLHVNRIWQIKHEMARLRAMGLQDLPSPKLGAPRKKTLHNGCYGKAGPPKR